MNPTAAVGVIDIGSNTIKSLLARSSPGGRVIGVRRDAADVRLGTGVFSAGRAIPAETLERAALTVASFAESLRRHGAGRLRIVATSAVRDAANGHDLARRVRELTGIPLDVISGEEEALLIGRGLLCDPDLPRSEHLRLADLGGGSLELLAFASGAVTLARSLPLGCVRLAAKFHPDLDAPLPPAAAGAIEEEVRARLTEAGLEPAHRAGILVGTGGTLTTVRAILAARRGIPPEEAHARVTLGELRALLEHLAPLALAERRRTPGLPPARADVMPVAVATLEAFARIAGADAYHHSHYNLRFGAAAGLLDGAPPDPTP